MSYKYGRTSMARLKTCHTDIQKVMNEVIKVMDVSILEGFRTEEKQQMAYAQGKSKVQYPDSKHNKIPSMAVDAAPYPIDWMNSERFYLLVGLVKGMSQILYDRGEISHLIRSGGDWDNDGEITDNKWNDLPHFELYKP